MYQIRLLISLLIVTKISGYDYYPSIGLSYKFIESPINWNRARMRCEVDNATLAVPKTTKELDVMISIFASQIKLTETWVDKIFWLGYHDFFEEGTFIGVNDHHTIPNVLRWISGEPNEVSVKVNQDCAAAARSSEIHDAPCEWDLRYFCQKDPKPTMTEENSKADSSPCMGDYNLIYALWPKNVSSKILTDAIENIQN